MTADSQDGYTPLNTFSLKANLPQMIFAQPRNVHSILEKHHARLGQANVHLLERQTADRSSDQPSLVLGECSLASLTARIIWKAVSDFPRSIDRIDPPFRPPRLGISGWNIGLRSPDRAMVLLYNDPRPRLVFDQQALFSLWKTDSEINGCNISDRLKLSSPQSRIA